MTFRIVSAAALLALAGVAAAEPVVHGTLDATELEHIDRLAVALDAHWNAREVEPIAALYTADGSLEFVGQQRGANGRDAIATYFTTSFAQLPPGLKHETVVDRLTVLAPGMVLADSSVALTRNGEIVRQFAVSNVVVKEADGWKLRTVRTFQLPGATSAVPPTPQSAARSP